MKQLMFMLFAILLIGPGCKSELKENQLTVASFRKNKYNFKLTKNGSYKNIRFKLSPFFEKSFATYYMISSKGQAYKSEIIPIYFTVERFKETDRYETFLIDQLTKVDFLNTLHDAYVKKRYSSLQNGAISIKKTVRKSIHYPGVIQTIAGASSTKQPANYYLTATLQVKDEYYVFQFISDRAIMSYVYDDFERILRSVKRIP
jgi:hypothetical protein